MVSPAKSQVDVALFAAVRSGDTEATMRLLQAGGNVNYRGGLFAERPLHIAASKGNTEMVALLLDHGAAVDATCERRNTPLHEAVLANSLDVLLLLCDAGADVNAKNKTGAAPVALVKQKKLLAHSPAEIQAAAAITRFLKGGGRDARPPGGATGLPPPPGAPAGCTPPPSRSSQATAASGRRPNTADRAQHHRTPQQAPSRPRPERRPSRTASSTEKVRAFSVWFEGLRDESGVVRWSTVQEELLFAEELCRALRAADVTKQTGTADAADLISRMVPDAPPGRVQRVVADTAPPGMLQDPLGWVAANFPTQAALRAAWRVCTNAMLSRIVAAKVRLLDAAHLQEAEAGASSALSAAQAVGTPQDSGLQPTPRKQVPDPARDALVFPSGGGSMSMTARSSAATCSEMEVSLLGAGAGGAQPYDTEEDSESVSPPPVAPPRF